MNSVQLIGRMGKDPELKYTTSNTPVITFSLAVDRRKTEDGKKEADWITCVAWNTTAELISKYTSKGDQIGVNGRITTRSWEDNDGKKRNSTEVLVSEITLIGNKEKKAEPKKEIPEPGYYDPTEDETPF